MVRDTGIAESGIRAAGTLDRSGEIHDLLMDLPPRFAETGLQRLSRDAAEINTGMHGAVPVHGVGAARGAAGNYGLFAAAGAARGRKIRFRHGRVKGQAEELPFHFFQMDRFLIIRPVRGAPGLRARRDQHPVEIEPEAVLMQKAEDLLSILHFSARGDCRGDLQTGIPQGKHVGEDGMKDPMPGDLFIGIITAAV